MKTKRKVTRKTPSITTKTALNAAYGKFAVAPISSASLKTVMTRASRVLKQTARIQAEINKLASL